MTTSVIVGGQNLDPTELAARVRFGTQTMVVSGTIVELLTQIVDTDTYVAFAPHTAGLRIVEPFAGRVSRLIADGWNDRRVVSRDRLDHKAVVQYIAEQGEDGIDAAAQTFAELVVRTTIVNEPSFVAAATRSLDYDYYNSHPELRKLAKVVDPSDMMSPPNPIEALANFLAGYARALLADAR